eukprot:scaffold187936_cov15-Prasinocladus_malaysianus.AAC.1
MPAISGHTLSPGTPGPQTHSVSHSYIHARHTYARLHCRLTRDFGKQRNSDERTDRRQYHRPPQAGLFRLPRAMSEQVNTFRREEGMLMTQVVIA